MNNQISIIGCGWLGLPLAAELIKNGHRIKGSTTSADKLKLLEKEGIIPFVVSISEEGIEGDITDCLKDSEVLIINIPPGLRKHPEANFVKKMELLCSYVERSGIKNIIYVSSTSVYDEHPEMPLITEQSPKDNASHSAQQLIGAEDMFRTNSHFETTILRFGGLIGPERHPAKYLSGKKDLKDPEGPVNLIHQDDCIGIVKSILKNNSWNTDFNAAAPQHPSRQLYYTEACKNQNLPVPHFDHSVPSRGKIISSKKVERILNYRFQHPL